MMILLAVILMDLLTGMEFDSLIFIALSLQIASCFYEGSFRNIGFLR